MRPIRIRAFATSARHSMRIALSILSSVSWSVPLASHKAKLDKLNAVLALASTSVHDAALLAEMLSLPNDGRYPTLDLTPQQRRQKTIEALIGQLQALSRSNPVLMILEDVHWIDPTSLEALGRTLDRLKTLGVLLVITYRPEF